MTTAKELQELIDKHHEEGYSDFLSLSYFEEEVTEIPGLIIEDFDRNHADKTRYVILKYENKYFKATSYYDSWSSEDFGDLFKVKPREYMTLEWVETNEP